MNGPLVILIGASGVGKTTISREIVRLYPDIVVFDSDAVIGAPSQEDLKVRYGLLAQQAGEAWQRNSTRQWIECIEPLLSSGKAVLLDFQTRIAFILEALAACNISHAKIILAECDDATRNARLHGRGSPLLADDTMSNWSRYLHREAEEAGLEVIDTGVVPLEDSVARIAAHLGFAR